MQHSAALGENLRESTQRMETILQHAPDAVISIDHAGIIRSWNPEAEQIFGWKEPEVIGKLLTETIIPPAFRDQHRLGIENYIATGEGPVINKAIELSALKKDGTEFPVELKISATKINGEYIFIGFIRDISVRKESEETIRNKTTQLLEAQQLAHIGSWEWDVTANKVTWTDELYRIYGLMPGAFDNGYEGYLRYIHPDDHDYMDSIVKKALTDHQPYNIFHKTAGADGTVKILHSTGKVFTDAAGKVIKLSGTTQDVTAQKQYEEDLKLGEERFYKIFDSNPVAMTLSEIKTNKIRYANSGFYSLFGYGEAEVIGHSSEELNLLDTEEYNRVVGLIFSYLSESRSLEEVQGLSKEETEGLLVKLRRSDKMKDFEVQYTRKNGETFPALVSFELIRIGAESFTVTSYHDITTRKKAEALLRTQNDLLENMNRELQSFAYVSSHDLQEPLRKIQTYADMLAEKEQENLSASGQDMFRRMRDAAKRMQTLIRDLLAYSRTGNTERKFERVNLDALITDLKEELSEELTEKKAVVQADHLGEIVGIDFQLRQLFQNLISNSLKFSVPGRAPVICISTQAARGRDLPNERLLPDHKYCRISFSDNGIGFEDKYKEKIFEVFQRLHGKDAYAGTGIGLSIIKKIVENHSGVITASGILNEGARFDIYLPAS